MTDKCAIKNLYGIKTTRREGEYCAIIKGSNIFFILKNIAYHALIASNNAIGRMPVIS